MDDDFSYHLDAARFNQRAAQKAKESKQQADKKNSHSRLRNMRTKTYDA